MEYSTESYSDKFVSLSKLLFQLAHGQVNLERLPNVYLKKSLSTSHIDDSKSNNCIEEGKENQSKYHLEGMENNGAVTIVDNRGDFRIVRHKDGSEMRKMIVALCQNCDKKIAGIVKARSKTCQECSEKYSLFSCGNCNQKYSHFESLRTHLYKVCCPLTEYLCNYCNFKCAKVTSVQSHLLRHQPSPSNFGAAQNSDKHKSQDPLFQCDMCPFKTAFKSSLLSHLKSKHQETVAEPPNDATGMKLGCEKCGKSFAKKSGLSEHAKFCQKPPTMQCPLCPHKTYRDSMMKKHMKMRHAKLGGKSKDSGNITERDERKKDKKERMKNTKDDLLPYVVDRIKMDSKIMVKRVCKDCKKTHDNPKRRSTNCPWCDGSLLYACRKCKMLFPNYEKIKNHVRYTCFGKTSFYCRKCNCKRSSKEFILKHISNEHRGGRIL